MEHKLEDIIAIFNQCFEEEYNTRLVKGGDEPIYIPANDEVPYNAIYFARAQPTPQVGLPQPYSGPRSK